MPGGEFHVSAVSRRAWVMGLCALFLIQAQAEDEQGLILRFTNEAGKSDIRKSRTVALHVPQGQSRSPFLADTAFRARWEGKMLLEKRS